METMGPGEHASIIVEVPVIGRDGLIGHHRFSPDALWKLEAHRGGEAKA
jgi:hypothetical protein